jgi:hypothetical protein
VLGVLGIQDIYSFQPPLSPRLASTADTHGVAVTFTPKQKHRSLGLRGSGRWCARLNVL